MSGRSGPSRSLTVVTGLLIIAASGGGGLLVLLAGQPWIGSLLIIAALVVGGLALFGRLGSEGQLSRGQVVVILLGIAFLVIALLMQGAILPRAFSAGWYLYLAIVLLLAAATAFLAVRDYRSSNELQ